jgi:hypothetical protein
VNFIFGVIKSFTLFGTTSLSTMTTLINRWITAVYQYTWSELLKNSGALQRLFAAAQADR